MPQQTAMDLVVTERVAVLTLGRAPVNAMNDAWVAEFHAVLDTLAARDDWSVLHVRSALKVFCAGADLKQLRDNFDEEPAVQAEVGRRYQALFRRIEALDAVTLAEIGGAALGGGLEMALACDLRVAAQEARLGLPEVGLGLIPGAGGTQRLTLLCGRAQALRLILGAELIDGAEAHRIGLLQWVVPRADLPGRAAAIARDYARLPRHAVAAAKACIAVAGSISERGEDTEVAQARHLLGTGETRSLVAAFLLKTSGPAKTS